IFSSHQLELVERISDRVGIIAAGRMVALGSVEELRTGGQTVIDVRGPSSPSWAATLPGGTVLEHTGEHTRVQLGEDVDDQKVLQAALRAGPVREFSRHRPGLTELYRDVVRAPARAETVPVSA